MAISLVLILALLAISAVLAVERPKTEVVQGSLMGDVVASYGGRQFASFRGVPYAAAPVGERRLAAPAPAPKWTGTRDCGAEMPGASIVCAQMTFHEVICIICYHLP